MSRYDDEMRQETLHDIVEEEAAHDYYPEPDYDRPTEAEEAGSLINPWQRQRRSPAPVPPPASARRGRTPDEVAEHPQHERRDQHEPEDVRREAETTEQSDDQH